MKSILSNSRKSPYGDEERLINEMNNDDHQTTPIIRDRLRRISTQDDTQSIMSMGVQSHLCSQDRDKIQNKIIRMVQGQVSHIRRSFYLLSGFDMILFLILWLMKCAISGKPIYTVIVEEVVHYDVKRSTFDLLILSIFRFSLLMAGYGCMKTSQVWIVAVSTILTNGSCVFKIVMISRSHSDPLLMVLVLLIIFCSFIISWVELWFFGFRVLPTETKFKSKLRSDPLLREYFNYINWRLNADPATLAVYNTFGIIPSVEQNHGINLPFNRSRQHSQLHSEPLPETLGSTCERLRRQRFPELSANSDTEDEAGDRYKTPLNEMAPNAVKETLSVDDIAFARFATEATNKLGTLIDIDKTGHRIHKQNTLDGWTITKNIDNDTVYTKIIKKRKVIRLESVINCSPFQLFTILFTEIDQMPYWNPNISKARILRKLDDSTVITYTVAKEALNGTISARDFVTINQYVAYPPSNQDTFAYLLSGMSITHPEFPPVKNTTRGITHPSGYAIARLGQPKEHIIDETAHFERADEPPDSDEEEIPDNEQYDDDDDTSTIPRLFNAEKRSERIPRKRGKGKGKLSRHLTRLTDNENNNARLSIKRIEPTQRSLLISIVNILQRI
ncbi:hypothetical protein SNEBB_010377 [Seison nebaliae]|nr:hypothetical protein SNEBB_010377 [Seison nebaliae]